MKLDRTRNAFFSSHRACSRFGFPDCRFGCFALRPVRSNTQIPTELQQPTHAAKRARSPAATAQCTAVS
eukprot:6825662-Prymnesium_polylepis.1